jgi:type III pantothenate kinase
MTGSASIVTVDCGNSTIDCLSHASGERRRIARDVGAADALRGFLRCEAPTRLVVASVVPASLEQVRDVAAELGVGVAVAGVDLSCPLRMAYETPATLGVDRWVGCVAAHLRFGRAVVVDCGTATTVNAVDADGTFLGGPIGPGLPALVAGMAHATPALPAPRLDVETVDAAARSTQAAVDAGVLLGYCGLVERLVTNVLASMPAEAVFVLTGGNAERFLRHSRLRAEHVPDLVHRGLARLAELAWNG